MVTAALHGVCFGPDLFTFRLSTKNKNVDAGHLRFPSLQFSKLQAWVINYDSAIVLNIHFYLPDMIIVEGTLGMSEKDVDLWKWKWYPLAVLVFPKCQVA